MTPRKQFLLLLLTAIPLVVNAQQLDEEESPAESTERIDLDPIVVVASKSPRPLSEVAGQVIVIDADDIRANMAEDLDGMLRYEPGLDLETSGTRFGATSINIRGIGGNRVGIEIDGIPMRDQFAIGAYSNGGRDLVEPDRVKRVEVLYGPASVMYGSDALGGIVAVNTWDPVDLTSRTSHPAWVSLRAGYQGANESHVGSGVVAWGNETHGMLAAATFRSGHELDNNAPSGTVDDPQDWDSQDFLARYTFDTNGGNRLRLTAAGYERDINTEINSLLGYGRRFRNTTELLGVDHDESSRLSVDYEFSAGGWQQGRVSVFRTEFDTDQQTFEERALALNPVDIFRRFLYEQEMTGLELSGFREAYWGESRHRIGMGLEWLRTDTSELRDGLQTSLVDGSTTNVVLGETMPVRDFPDSRTDEISLFVQDEIAFLNGRFEIIPALRWDDYDLEPKPDPIFEEDNPDTTVVPLDDSRLTPRLGVLYHLTSDWTLYGQYAAGFRAPPFSDANIGFDIPLFGYRAIPNPDLESETSDGFELGVRRIAGGSRFSLALFHTDYDDFIESRALVGFDPETGDLLFQSRNIDKARIKGIDIRYDQDLGAWHTAMDGFFLNAAGWWAEGDNRESDQPLNSIAPPQAVVGVSWVSPDAAWDIGLHGVFTSSKDPDEIDESDGERFATPGWATLDLTVGWRAGQHFELRGGVFNLTDKRYWRWLDVANLDATDPMIDLLSRPGRSFSLSATFTW